MVKAQRITQEAEQTTTKLTADQSSSKERLLI